MPTPAHLALCALLAAGVPAMAQELDPEQAGLLEQAREAAMRYSDSLPDFICTEVVDRSQDPQGNGRWRQLDRLTVKLSYFDHKEDYKLMEINGKPTVLEYLYAGGALSTGEFGTGLYAVFDPRSHGEFRWKGWTTLRKRRAARFSYHIARQNSTYLIQYGAVPSGPNAIYVAYRGEVLVDEETHLVLRLTQQAEIPSGFPIDANESTVDYEFAAVGGKQHLLPTHAYTKTRSGKFVAENNMAFRDYRKFQAEASISFDAPPEKK
ncbi:MAG: hypothetical protein NTW28_21015 [Candidatus Solibacter sp.]|nr:hypothetical protein [Candidatus Solibacter sp.]